MNVYMRGLSERGIDRDSDGFLFVVDPADREAQAFLNARFERAGENRWQIPRQTFGAKATSMLRATVSGRAPAEVVAKRRISCFGDGAAPPCSALERTPLGAFCKECDCPQRRWTRMDGWKIERAFLTCPRGMPGFSNEVAP